MRRVLVAVVVLAACRGGGGAAVPPGTGVLDANAAVVHVVDGDTIDVTVGGARERVRLTGVDTPEVAHPGTPERPGNAAECFADAASAFVAALIPVGTPLRLERDVVSRDDYGRLLAYVYRADDGVFVNYELVRQGYARPLSIAPNVTHRDRFVDAARLADDADAGLWGACP